MKINLRTFIKIFCIINLVTSIKADIGCMDNSKHRNTYDGFDYKTLHYVRCSCPCREHKNLVIKGRCSKCLHFHKPDDIYHF